MNINWKRITPNVWDLGNFQAVQETPGQWREWRVYRGRKAMLQSFPTVELAMADAERLKAGEVG